MTPLPHEPTEPPDAAVVLRDFTVAYGATVAVDQATFAMPRGACGLLGQNGAGKSSVLKAILGLVRPRSGSALVLGEDTSRAGARLRDRIGYMPEREAAIPGLSGLDMVELAGRLSGLPKGDARQRAHEALWLVGLEEARYRTIDGYSLGMKQKAKLAAALVHDPDLLFLDEPTNGLDPAGRREVLDLMRDLVLAKGKSLILSSHILPDVEAVCGHVVLMDRGRVVREGPIGELTRQAIRTWEVRVRGDRAAFLAGLERAGLTVTGAGDDGFLVSGVDVPARTLFEIARAADCQVRKLEPQRRTLSDVYLDAVRRVAPARALATGTG